MEEKTEGLKCMDVCRDGWMVGRIQVYRAQFPFFLKLGLVVGFMRGSRRRTMGLDGARG